MSKKKQIITIYLLLAVVTLLAFWQIHDCDFINFDDPEYVTENSHVLKGITADGIRWAFMSGHASNWHPLTWISHMLDVQFFGLNPHWHHLMNLLFHIANTLLLFFVLHRMTKVLWPSVVVAALFALHPLHVESVAWVSERKDVLSAFFWMLTLNAYVSYVASPNRWRYLIVLLFFGLGLMAKPMLVTLPFVLLLLDYWPLRRFGRTESALAQKNSEWITIRSLIWEKVPFFVLAFLSSIVTFVVQQKGGMIQSLQSFPFEVRLQNALISYITYMVKTIWPTHLAFLYPYPSHQQLWHVLGAVLVFVSITIFVIRAAKNSPYLTVGWFWYVGTLVPVIGFIQLALQARADRYTYLPHIGLFIMAAWGIPELIGKWRYRGQALFALSIGFLVFFFIVTVNQLKYWKNSFTLYDHTIKITDSNFLAYGNRGYAYASAGDYQQAIADYDRSITINPNIMMVHFNRGYANYKLGNYKQSIMDYEKAIEIVPGSSLSYFHLALTYEKLGNEKEAIKNYDKAIEITPESPLAYFNRGNAYAAFGQTKRAIEDYGKAIGIDPQYVQAYLNQGCSYHDLGNDKQAIMNYNRAIEIDPHNAEIYYNRAISYAKLGNVKQAIADDTRAIELNPKFAQAYYNRGNAYKALNDQRHAIMDYTTAIEINSKFAQAYFNRAVAYSVMGNKKEVIKDLKMAAALGMISAQNYLEREGISW